MEAAIVRFYFDTQTVPLGSPTPADRCQTWMKVEFCGEEALPWRLTSEYKVQGFRIPQSPRTHPCQALGAEAALGSLGQLGKLMGALRSLVDTVWSQDGKQAGGPRRLRVDSPSLTSSPLPASLFPSATQTLVLCERKLAGLPLGCLGARVAQGQTLSLSHLWRPCTLACLNLPLLLPSQ